MSKRLSNFVIGLAAVIFGVTAAAQNITIPNTFVNGTVADADQVNANFSALSSNALNRTAGIMTGTLTFSPDNALDIGATGATRPRDLFLGRNATIGGTLAVTGTSTFTGTASLNGAVTLGDAAADVVTFAGTATSLLTGIAEGRLSLTSATPVTGADVTAATTIYYTPYKGDRIALYTGSVWALTTFTEIAWNFGTITATVPYDLFIWTNGTVQMTQVAWTNTTTRATTLTTLNGVLVQTGDATKRYLGTFMPTSTTTTEDSCAKRFLWNYYNRVPRSLCRLETTNSWPYSTATFRQANNAAANQVSIVVGEVGVPLEVNVFVNVTDTNISDTAYVAIGEDSTTTPAAGILMQPVTAPTTTAWFIPSARLKKTPAVGKHDYVWLEKASGVGTTTWFGDNGAADVQGGMDGWIEG